MFSIVKRLFGADEPAPAAAAAPPPTRRRTAEWAEIRELEEHPRNARVRMSNAGSVPKLWFDGARCDGMTRFIRAIFYPDYDYETARHNDTSVPEGEYTIPLAVDGARKGGKATVTGAARGTVVDDDLRLWANDRVAFCRKRKHPAMTLDIIAALEQWKFDGRFSQFPLVADDIRIWTPVDMIAVHEVTGRPILLEFKTGYETYLNKYTANMRGPLSDKRDTPLNQFYVQLGLEMIIALKYYGFRFTKNFVLQAMQSRGVVPHELPSWVFERRDAIWQFFCDGVRAVRLSRTTAKAHRVAVERRHPNFKKRT